MQEALRPRTAVIAEVWAELGIEAPALVNRAGVPLARAVKCLLDPLVLQPRVNRSLARALFGAEETALARTLLSATRTQLENASAWYELLRAQRTQLGITDGNPQEAYFPRAFELAVNAGAPGTDAPQRCADVLAEVHGQAQPDVPEVLGLLSDPATQRGVADEWAGRWGRGAAVEDVSVIAALIVGALSGEAEPLGRLLASDVGGRVGLALHHQVGLLDGLLAAVGVPCVQLSIREPVQPPALTGRGTLPLDRTLEQRLRAALRRHREHDTPIGAGELIEEECLRAAMGFGLAGADVQALFLVGVALAAALEPLNPWPGTDHPELVADAVARARKEAYVMHLSRELAGGRAVHPDQEPVVAALREFWRPWLNRLWVRLHGRDVTETPVDEDAVELLTGITRSVLLDHRQQIRGSLERLAA